MNRYTVQYTNLANEAAALVKKGLQEVMTRPHYASANYALAAAFQSLSHYGAPDKQTADALLDATAGFRNGTAKPDHQFYLAINSYFASLEKLRPYIDAKEQEHVRAQALKSAEIQMKKDAEEAEHQRLERIAQRMRDGDPTLFDELVKLSRQEALDEGRTLDRG